MALEHLDIHMKKSNLDPYLTYIQILFKIDIRYKYES